MKYFNNKGIKHITLISSESCNLNCSYCEIAKSVSKSTNNQSKQVKDSLLNGTFLENIKKIVKRLNIDPKQITAFDLWGQEPTLTLDAVNTMLPDFFNFFPNLQKSLFSSNMVQYPERILDYILTIENICKTQGKTNFNINIQFSYDGEENTRKNRGIDPSIILNNIEWLIKKLNDIQFNYLNISFHFNNVLAKNEIIKLDTYEKIENYWKNLDKISKYYIDLNTNKKVIFRRNFGAGLEFPINATKEEGQKLTNFLQISQQIDLNNKNDSTINYKNYLQIKHRLANSYKILYEYFNDFDEFLDKIVNYDFDPIFVKKMSRPLFCGPGVGGLKIRYDGSIVHCHNVIHHMKIIDFKERKGWKYDNLKSLATHNFYPNLLTDDIDKIDDYFYKMNIIQNTSFPYIYSLIVRLMVQLRDINQIDDCYKEDKILLEHALLITKLITCLDGTYQVLGSGMGAWPGAIRYYCNGALSLLDSEKKYYQNKGRERKNGK